MRWVYKVIGYASLISGLAAEALALIAILGNAPDEIRALRSIQCGVLWVVAMVSFGNVDRLDAAKRAETYYSSWGR